MSDITTGDWDVFPLRQRTSKIVAIHSSAPRMDATMEYSAMNHEIILIKLNHVPHKGLCTNILVVLRLVLDMLLSSASGVQTHDSVLLIVTYET